MSKTGWKISAIGLALVMATGCGVELEGEEGELTFRYLDTDFQSSSVSGALATGASIDVEVRAVGGESALSIKEAFSESSDIIDVVNVGERRFTLEAKTEGTARIRAEADGADGETLSDSVEIDSAEVARVTFDSRCTDDVFITDSGAHFVYRMYDSADNRLTGYGVYPVSVDPAEGGSVNPDLQLIDTVDISTGSEPGTYSLVSDVGEASYEFDLVDSDAITNLSLDEDNDETEHSVSTGEEVAVAAFTMEADGKSVCGPARAAIELTTETEDVCSPSYRFLGSLHLVYIEGLAAGDCEVKMEVPGTDIERNFSVEVH